MRPLGQVVRHCPLAELERPPSLLPEGGGVRDEPPHRIDLPDAAPHLRPASAVPIPDRPVLVDVVAAGNLLDHRALRLHGPDLGGDRILPGHPAPPETFLEHTFIPARSKAAGQCRKTEKGPLEQPFPGIRRIVGNAANAVRYLEMLIVVAKAKIIDKTDSG